MTHVRHGYIRSFAADHAPTVLFHDVEIQVHGKVADGGVLRVPYAHLRQASSHASCISAAEPERRTRRNPSKPSGDCTSPTTTCIVTKANCHSASSPARPNILLDPTPCERPFGRFPPSLCVMPFKSMNLLMCCVCTSGDDTCTLNFSTALLNFLNGIDGKHQVNVNFVDEVAAALDTFARDTSYDRLVLCNTRCTPDVSFMNDALGSKHAFVTGVVPRPLMDWDKVKAHLASSDVQGGDAEDVKHAGLTYNVDLEHAGAREGDYVQVRETTLQVAVLRRAVVAKLLSAFDGEVRGADRHDLYSSRVRDGKFLTADANFCHMWGGPIMADVAHPISIAAPMGFLGTVGLRTKLR